MDENQEFTPELFRDLIETQKEEIVIQREQLNLAKQQDQNAYEYSMRSLELQAEDMKDDRKARGVFFNKFMILIFLVVTVFGFFSWMLVYYKETKLLYEILKGIGTVGASGFGGYYFGKNRCNKTQNDN